MSVQVLPELSVAAPQKVKEPLPQMAAVEIIQDLAFWRVPEPIAEEIVGAIDLQRRHKVSFWDAMIIWSASQLGCSLIWSEDLGTGRSYDGVLVKDPFLS